MFRISHYYRKALGPLCYVLFLMAVPLDAFNTRNQLHTSNTSVIFQAGGKIEPDDGSINNFTRRDSGLTSLPALTQRALMSYPVYGCAELCGDTVSKSAQYFNESHCAEGQTERWFLVCAEHDPPQSPEDFDGCSDVCHPGTKCYDITIHRPDSSTMAWCVSEYDTWLFSSSTVEEVMETFTISPPEEPFPHGDKKTNGNGGSSETSSTNGNVEVILTGKKDDNTIFNANSITLRARDKNFNEIGSPSMCKSCGRLSYGPWPKGTVNIKATLAMPPIRAGTKMLVTYYWRP